MLPQLLFVPKHLALVTPSLAMRSTVATAEQIPGSASGAAEALPGEALHCCDCGAPKKLPESKGTCMARRSRARTCSKLDLGWHMDGLVVASEDLFIACNRMASLCLELMLSLLHPPPVLITFIASFIE